MFNSNHSDQNTLQSQTEFSVSLLEKVVIVLGAVSLIMTGLIMLNFKEIKHNHPIYGSNLEIKAKIR